MTQNSKSLNTAESKHIFSHEHHRKRLYDDIFDEALHTA